MSDKRLTILALLSVLFTLPYAQAQTRDDMRRALEGSVEQKAAERNHSGPEKEADFVEAMQEDEATPEQAAPMLYQALQRQDWAVARKLLARYQHQPEPDAMLLHYARGTLARADGNLDAARLEFEALLRLQPNFLLGRLSLARVLFEDGQLREANHIFEQAQTLIDGHDTKTAGVRKSIAMYQDSIRQRENWQGSIAIGLGRSDNVNRSSASRTCLYSAPGGRCLVERKLPDAISGAVVNFYLGVQRDVPVLRHHGLTVRALLYGTRYPEHRNYNEGTLTLRAGYRYRTPRQQFLLAPYFEYAQQGRSALYGGTGLYGEWSVLLSPRDMLRLEGDYQLRKYRADGYAHFFDGGQSSAYVTFIRDLGRGWNGFGSLDWADSRAMHDFNRYRQNGVRLGIGWDGHGWNSQFSASWRKRQYAIYDPRLAARRADIEQSYTLTIQAPRWRMLNMTPSLNISHLRVRSNVGWLYGYQRNEVGLKLERSF